MDSMYKPCSSKKTSCSVNPLNRLPCSAIVQNKAPRETETILGNHLKNDVLSRWRDADAGSQGQVCSRLPEAGTCKKRKPERPLQYKNFYCPSPDGHVAEISAMWPAGEGQ